MYSRRMCDKATLTTLRLMHGSGPLLQQARAPVKEGILASPTGEGKFYHLCCLLRFLKSLGHALTFEDHAPKLLGTLALVLLLI